MPVRHERAPSSPPPSHSRSHRTRTIARGAPLPLTEKFGRRHVAAVVTTAAAVASLSGCVPGWGLEGEAVDEAQYKAVDTIRILEMLARQEVGAPAELMVSTLDEKLEDRERVAWWDRTETGPDSATWRMLHVGSAQESGIGGAYWAAALICTDATLTFDTGEIATSDVDCPEEVADQFDAVDADLGDLAD